MVIYNHNFDIFRTASQTTNWNCLKRIYKYFINNFSEIEFLYLKHIDRKYSSV